MAYERILVGTDGSPTALAAVRDAASLAAADGAHLMIVSAYDGERDPTWAESVLAAARELATAAGSPEVAVRAVPGGPADALLAAARHELSDLLVVGSTGLTHPERFVLGSVANQVSHDAPCDVLIVQSGRGGSDFRPAVESGNIDG